MASDRRTSREKRKVDIHIFAETNHVPIDVSLNSWRREVELLDCSVEVFQLTLPDPAMR